MDRNQLLNDGETAFRVGMDGRQAQIWTAIPAIVQTVDLIKMTLTAQPTIQGVVTNADDSISYVNLPILADVPICYPSAGGFTLTLPIAVNDEVLIIFSSRCIDSWWQSGGIGQPIELRMHDLSDGFAIPGPRSQARLVSGISAVNAQLRTDDGTSYIEITPSGKVNIVAPLGVGITGDLLVTGSVMANGEVSAGAIDLSTHTHPVTTAPGTTGAPT